MSTNSGATQPHQPSPRQHRCLSVTCTGCGERYDDECDHFASIADAVREIAAQDCSISQAAVLCPTT